ncbi:MULTISPECIES: hypothetical protein [Mesorhizobium]|jgi:hypothetical protein|uniref:Phage head-tail connector protein n=1 Tax=Mesorhizobium hungaricum TaxID=1566387 RepID=A0A1C2DD68_9HYPH|nr:MULTISPECIES: hypothetical protein [unclassified Mesorhizobium]OCX12700.1 hypothetical protein QV13_24185 [Mesorhizobium hungaricum]
MRSKFEVVVAATGTLLSIAQLRTAAGLSGTDTSRDTELQDLGKRVAAEIAIACRVRGDGVAEPTLLAETVRDTFRETGCDTDLFLSRLFASSISSIVEAGNTLAATDTYVDGGAGIVRRISGTRDLRWRRGEIVIEYVAGFTTVPSDLIGIAMDLCRLRLSADAVDPLERATTITIPDVETRRIERWVGAVPGSSAGPLPDDIMNRLGRYITPSFAA